MFYRIKIKLRGITKPPVWRIMDLDGKTTLEGLCDNIRYSFGWSPFHMSRLELPQGYVDIGGFEHDENLDVPISEVLCEGMKFRYIYDFGDWWVHDCTVLDVLQTKRERPPKKWESGAAPPEDCGGAARYMWMKKVMEDPDDPDYDEVNEWFGVEEGETFDPDDTFSKW